MSGVVIHACHAQIFPDLMFRLLVIQENCALSFVRLASLLELYILFPSRRSGGKTFCTM